MRFFDPLRQLGANGLPKYEGLIETLPSWHLRPLATAGLCEVLVWLPRGANRYSYGTLELRIWDLPEELERYKDDPELWLEQKLKWNREDAAKPSRPAGAIAVSKSASSTDDLGF